MKLLLERKDIVVTCGKFEKPPLMEAAACGNEEVVELLLKRSDTDINTLGLG